MNIANERATALSDELTKMQKSNKELDSYNNDLLAQMDDIEKENNKLLEKVAALENNETHLKDEIKSLKILQGELTADQHITQHTTNESHLQQEYEDLKLRYKLITKATKPLLEELLKIV